MNLRDFVEAAKPAVLDHDNGYTQVRCLSAFTLWVYDDDKSLTPNLISDGFWEAWITAWMMRNIKAGSNFMDIGAHCGYYTFLADYLGASVHAYEPNPIYRDSILESTEDNQADVTLHAYALGAKQGMANLSYPDNYSGSATLKENFEGSNFEVPVFTLADEFAEYGVPDIIKIDAEGAETDIFDGAKFDELDKKPILVVEHFPRAKADQLLLEKLRRYGNITEINYSGEEMPYAYRDEPDWITLVVRP